MSTRKRYTKEFKLEAVRLLEQGDHTAAELSRELGVRRNQLYKWQQVLKSKGEGAAFRGPGRNAAADQWQNSGSGLAFCYAGLFLCEI